MVTVGSAISQWLIARYIIEIHNNHLYLGPFLRAGVVTDSFPPIFGCDCQHFVHDDFGYYSTI